MQSGWTGRQGSNTTNVVSGRSGFGFGAGGQPAAVAAAFLAFSAASTACFAASAATIGCAVWLLTALLIAPFLWKIGASRGAETSCAAVAKYTDFAK